MPPQLTQTLEFVSNHRYLFFAGGITFILLLTAIITLVVAFRRPKLPRQQPTSKAESVPKTTAREVPAPRVNRFRLAVGDIANPWTQGVYERNSPEAKLGSLLMAFAFDEAGGIRRSQHADLVAGIDLGELMRNCASASGVAVHGAYATLALWHAGDGRYAEMALKVSSHAHLPIEQKELIRFLFQDIIGVRLEPRQVPSLSHWNNRAFRTALALYTARRVKESEWKEMSLALPENLYPFYEFELAQKLPPRTIYRRARESRVYAEGLFRLNLEVLARYLNPKRWQRLQNSDKSARFAAWLTERPCITEADALLKIANPDVFELADIEENLAKKIESVLEGKKPQAWLFEGEKPPRLHFRLQYFKYFCLFGKYNEAVRCFATLGVFRRDRAQRLWYARALFLSGMPHEAWAEMSSLMTDFPRDPAVLNEAGIYAHKLGRYDEAAEIFGLARSYFPDDATIAYNEAVFTEQYSKKQVEEKWSRVQKLTQPPVVEG
jgi:tetratricopeptide (TPR) repeat protein